MIVSTHKNFRLSTEGYPVNKICLAIKKFKDESYGGEGVAVTTGKMSVTTTATATAARTLVTITVCSQPDRDPASEPKMAARYDRTFPLFSVRPSHIRGREVSDDRSDSSPSGPLTTTRPPFSGRVDLRPVVSGEREDVQRWWVGQRIRLSDSEGTNGS